MQTLPTTFKFDGFDFVQLKRTGDVALFEKTNPRHSVKHYEVVIVQKHKEHIWPNGDTSPERESMPNAKQWGKQGWTPYTLEAAERRFNLIVNDRSSYD
jgi:hypothetical protein